MFQQRNDYIAAFSSAFILLGVTLSATAVEPADPFNTSGAGATTVDFGTVDIPPIPADFFGPGSDPFDGVITFQGNPDNDTADTLIQRSWPIDCPGTGFPRFCGPVNIEIIALDLVSSAPITVTYNGGQDTELWNVELGLSQTAGPTPGILDPTLEKPEGGLFEAQIPIIPRFQFVLEANPGEVRLLDFGTEGIGEFDMLISQAPWVFSTERWDILAPSNGNFVPLVNNAEITVPSPLSTASGSVVHWIEPVPYTPPDPFHTLGNGATTVTFGSSEIPPIPADFFGPGSDPFEGQVAFQGSSGTAQDTLVQRSGAVVCPGTAIPRACDRVDIEIVSLTLVSIEPVVVTYNGGQDLQLWHIELSLAEMPQVPGVMDAMLEKPGGGLFFAVFPVIPAFRFVNEADPSEFHIVDFGAMGIPPLDMLLQAAPWVVSTSLTDILAPSNGNFVPLVNNGDIVVPSQLISQAGGGVIHWVEPVPDPNIPAVSQWGLVVLALLVLSAGTVVVARRRGMLANE